MTKYPLLEKAPPAHTAEFIDFLRENNPVIFENDQWIVIENCKYHTKKKPWLTAFWKGPAKSKGLEWWFDIDILWYEFGEYEWLKKAPNNQTIPQRFHIHLIKK